MEVPTKSEGEDQYLSSKEKRRERIHFYSACYSMQSSWIGRGPPTEQKAWIYFTQLTNSNINLICETPFTDTSNNHVNKIYNNKQCLIKYLGILWPSQVDTKINLHTLVFFLSDFMADSSFYCIPYQRQFCVALLISLGAFQEAQRW